MDILEPLYSVKTANEIQILEHLKLCSSSFYPELDSTVNLEEYAQKIYEKSVTFEAWNDKKLIGLIAVYLNDNDTLKAYITNVSLLTLYTGKGVASHLMKIALDYSLAKGFKTISLRVHKMNTNAINLYKKFAFNTIDTDKEFNIMIYKLN